MSVDLSRALRALVLGAWAAFFVWLIASGEIYRYIGPRTYWVVWFGAAALIAAFFSQLPGLRGAPGRSMPSGRQIVGLVAVMAPILIVVLIPTPKLGALAASNKTTGGIATATALQAPALQPGQKLSLVDISYASESEKYASALGISDGYSVDLTGFVTHPGDLRGAQFELTRFSIFCCAADVIPYSVPVDTSRLGGGLDFPDDTWLAVKGELARAGGEYVLVARRVKKVPEPRDPYI